MKFHGVIGFWLGSEEVRPGVYRPVIEEREYFGDILRNSRRWQGAEKQNDNLTISNQVSVLSDLYLQENLGSVRYILWMGVKWKVTNVEITYPRITLELGDVYHGEEQVGVTRNTV